MEEARRCIRIYSHRLVSFFAFLGCLVGPGGTAAQTIAQPYVYLFSGDLVLSNTPGAKDPIQDPAGLNGAHLSVLATVDSSFAPDVNAPYAIYRVTKTVLTISNAWIPSMNGTYTAVPGNDLVTLTSGVGATPSVSLFGLFQVGTSTLRGPLGLLKANAVANWPLPPEFDTSSVTGMNGFSVETAGIQRVYSFTNYSFTGQRVDLALPDKFWNLLNQLGGSGSTGPKGDAGPAGIAGAVGPAGPTGPVGAVGATGATGPTGPQGPIGGTGPQGPAGPVGPVGATGANGPQGIQGVPGLASASVARTTTPSVPIAGGGTYTASIACPAGKTVLGGGGDSSHVDVVLFSSRTLSNGWQVKFRNVSNKSVLALLSVEAVCAVVAVP